MARVTPQALRHALALREVAKSLPHLLEHLPPAPYPAYLAALALERVEELQARGLAVGAAIDAVAVEFDIPSRTLRRWREWP